MTDFESFSQYTDTRFVLFHFANNSEPLLTTYFPHFCKSFVSVARKNIPDVTFEHGMNLMNSSPCIFIYTHFSHFSQVDCGKKTLSHEFSAFLPNII